MNRIWGIFFIGVLLTPSVYNLSTLVHYAMEYDYYANVLCENKDKPELHCNGSCHLAAELTVSDQPQAPIYPSIRTFSVESCVPSTMELTSFIAVDEVVEYTCFFRAELVSSDLPIHSPPPKVSGAFNEIV